MAVQESVDLQIDGERGGIELTGALFLGAKVAITTNADAGAKFYVCTKRSGKFVVVAYTDAVANGACTLDLTLDTLVACWESGDTGDKQFRIFAANSHTANPNELDGTIATCTAWVKYSPLSFTPTGSAFTGKGDKGDAGKGISSIAIKGGTDNIAVITFTDTTTQELTLPRGQKGDDGQTQDLTNYATKSYVEGELADYATLTQLGTELADYVEKETGKGLSANDFTNLLKAKLDALKTQAQAETYIATKDAETLAAAKTYCDQKVTSVMDYKGSKSTVASLPSTGNKKGDVWYVTEDNAFHAWSGSQWEGCGGAAVPQSVLDAIAANTSAISNEVSRAQGAESTLTSGLASAVSVGSANTARLNAIKNGVSAFSAATADIDDLYTAVEQIATILRSQE